MQKTLYVLRGRPITTHAVLLWHRKGRGVPRNVRGHMVLYGAFPELVGADAAHCGCLPAAGQNRLQLQEGCLNTLIHVASLGDFSLGYFRVEFDAHWRRPEMSRKLLSE